MSSIREIQQVPEGERIVFRPTAGKLRGHIGVNVFWICMAATLAYWSGASVLLYLRILSRFFSKEGFFMKYEFGEGSFTRNSGILKAQTTYFGKNSNPRTTVVLLPEAAGADETPSMLMEGAGEIVLKVHGHGSQEIAEHLARILSETTGFPRA